MIADIEFRWAPASILRPKSGWDDGFTREKVETKVLQFRKQYHNIDELSSSYDWTDWQDVPVVEEK